MTRTALEGFVSQLKKTDEVVIEATGIRTVSLWLGHATLTTTEIYTRGDPTEKLDDMESIVPPHLRRDAFQPSDRLIALLKRPSQW